MDFPDFAVACGEEGSDPLVLHERQVVRVDQYRASAHLEHLDADLGDVAGLGVKVWRYGMPWRLAEPEPGVYDWSLWDRALAACDRHGVEPVVDLCHFGLPDHYAGFGDRTWIEGFVRYVESFLARYQNPMWFTPVNEPLITALGSGMWGIWNDRRASRHDYMRLLAHVTLANLEAIARISADRAGWWIGAEGFGCHLAATPEDEPAATAARDLDQLTWDLHLGVDPPSSVADVFDVVDPEVLARISDLAGPTERVVAGHDFYPISVMVHGVREEPLSITERVGAYEREARAWHARYQRPFWVAETSNLGLAVGDGPRWLHELVGALDRLCADGLPARGVCWYSRGDQVDWHTMLAHPIGEITEVGLFDAARRPRQVAQAYAALANQRAKQHRTRETMAT